MLCYHPDGSGLERFVISGRRYPFFTFAFHFFVPFPFHYNEYFSVHQFEKGGNTEIQSKVNELRELRRMADELTAEIESIQDAIKAHMTAIDADTLTGADYKITWKTVTSSRFDSTAFKKAMPELAERFTRSSTSRRFTVA